MADCHLGGWRQEELRKLNFESFQKAVDICIAERVNFVLISGDLFDSAYPPIEILKDSFAEFKRLHDAQIPVFLIAGSHDFSASGKTFLDVLEKTGFCKNVENFEVQEDGRIKLFPTMYKEIAIYGYPGRKSGMEVKDLSHVYFEGVHPFTIFMIHTTIKDVVGTIPMESIEKSKLPIANYYAMGHIHQVFDSEVSGSRFVYPGPTYPNNFQELADLKSGSLEIVEVEGSKIRHKNVKIPSREVTFIEIDLENALTATQKIISQLDSRNLNDKIVLLKLRGVLKEGKTGDINFSEIEDFVKKKGAYVFLRNLSSLKIQEMEFESDTSPIDNVSGIEDKILEDYSKKNPTDFNKYLPRLMSVLSIEKNEDEKSSVFEDRLFSELREVMELKNVI